MVLRLRGGCDDRPVEGLILDHAVRQGNAAEIADPSGVVHPDGSPGRTREISSHDDLHGEHLQLFRHSDVGVRDRDHLVGHDILGLLEPVLGDAIKHLSLERNCAQDVVKRALPVRGDEDALLREHIDVPDLARSVEPLPSIEPGLQQAVVQGGPDLFP